MLNKALFSASANGSAQAPVGSTPMAKCGPVNQIIGPNLSQHYASEC